MSGYFRRNNHLRRVSIAIALAVCATSAVSLGADLVRLRYNHPELVVDLGVGLWAFPMPIDWDRDGDMDLLVGCPDKPSNGIYLFENPGPKTEYLAGAQPPAKKTNNFPAFKPPVRLGGPAKQFLSLSYVGDQPHVLAANDEFPNFRDGDWTATRRVHPDKNVSGAKYLRGNFWRFGDYDGDGLHDLIVGQDVWDDFGFFDTNDWYKGYRADGSWSRGNLRGLIYVLRNTGTDARPKYAPPEQLKSTDGKPLETYGWPTQNYADFDGDGDFDFVCGEFLDGFTYFQNTGSRTAPKWNPGVKLAPKMDLQMIVPHAVDWDADGDVDLVVGDEDGRVALIEHTGKLEDGVPQFAEPRYFRQQQDEIDLGVLATPVGVDWDGDGDEDLLAGNSAGYVLFLENLSGPKVASPRWAEARRLESESASSGSAATTPRNTPSSGSAATTHSNTAPIREIAGPNGSIQGPAEAKWGYTTIGVADWDGDGLPDVIVNSIWGLVKWYRNEGTRIAPKLGAGAPIQVKWNGPPPKPAWNWWNPRDNDLVTSWRTTPMAVDFTGDGLCDLVMLDHEGFLCLWERRREAEGLVLLPPRRVLCDEEGKPLHLNAGQGGRSGRRKLTVADWDGDGRLDLLINGRNAEVRRGLKPERDADGRTVYRFAKPIDAAERNIEGHDTSPTTVDFDGNGIRDLVIGAEDGRLYYLENPRAAKSASPERK
jgi:hypothetical protein